MKITVVGSGAWGTALALLLSVNGNDVTLWSYFEKETQTMQETGENPFLKGVPISKDIGLTSDLGCVRGSDAVVLATPSMVRFLSRLMPLVVASALMTWTVAPSAAS